MEHRLQQVRHRGNRIFLVARLLWMVPYPRCCPKAYLCMVLTVSWIEHLSTRTSVHKARAPTDVSLTECSYEVLMPHRSSDRKTAPRMVWVP